MSAKTISLRLRSQSVDIYYTYMILVMFLVVLTSVFIKIPMLSLIIGIIETVYLIYVLFWRSIKKFTIIAIIILSTNIENAGFALGDKNIVIFNVYNLPIVRGYLLLCIMLLAVFKCFGSSALKNSRYKIKNKFLEFSTLNIVMAAMAFPMAVLALFGNDNNIFFYQDMWRYIARDVYEIIYAITLLTLVSYSLRENREFFSNLKKIMFAILSGTTWAAVLLIIMGNYYSLWGNEYYITCPLILFFSPGLILFFLEEYGIFHLLTGCVALLIQLKFTVGIAGTWWIYIGIISIVFLRKLLCYKDNSVKIFKKLICWFAVTVIVYWIIQSESLKGMTGQISYKMSTVLNMFERRGGIEEWYCGLNGSIQARIEETVNAMLELVNKIWPLPFGKGYGGTVVKYWGISNWNISGSTFPDVMIKHRIYSNFHIALAEIIINFGFLGIVLIAWMAKEFIGEFLKKDGNIWIILGVSWFMLFYSLYYSLNVGIVWLCCGLYEKYMPEKSKNYI